MADSGQNPTTRERYRVGDLHLDIAACRVTLREQEITLPRLSFEFLVALVRGTPNVISAEQLMNDVWRGVVVSDETVTQRAKLLRDALAAADPDTTYIETVRGRGYRLGVPAKRHTAEPGRPSNWAIAAGAFIAVVITVILWSAANDGTGNPNRVEKPGDSHLPGVAVMPFLDFSPDGDKAYFSDGMHDELLSRLAATGAFRVPSRTTMERYREAQVRATDIARELDVDAILEGSVRHAGDRVRVTVQLIDGTTDDHLWAQNYDRELSLEDLFAIQSDVAIAIARQMEAKLSAEQQRSLGDKPTESLEAYDAYLKGLHYGRRYNANDLRTAVALFQRAIELDAEFAMAWSALANSYAFAATGYGWLEPEEGMRLARETGARALELAPEHAMTLSLMGDIELWYERDFASAESFYLRAVANDPDLTGNRLSYAYLLSASERHDEALSQIYQSLAQEPRSARVHANASWRFFNARQFQKSIEHATQALEFDATMLDAHMARAYAHLFTGATEAAIADARLAGISESLGVTLAYAGETEEARLHLAALSQPPDGFVLNPVSLAMVHAALGEIDAAFERLQQAITIRHRGVLMVQVQPVFDRLRHDPRYAAIHEQIYGEDTRSQVGR